MAENMRRRRRREIHVYAFSNAILCAECVEMRLFTKGRSFRIKNVRAIFIYDAPFVRYRKIHEILPVVENRTRARAQARRRGHVTGATPTWTQRSSRLAGARFLQQLENAGSQIKTQEDFSPWKFTSNNCTRL